MGSCCLFFISCCVLLLGQEDNSEKGVGGVVVCEVSWQRRWRRSACGGNSQEEREKRACSEFPQGPRLGQGKMSRTLKVRKDVEKDGGEEGADEKVSKDGVKEKRRGVMGISKEGCMMLPVASVFALIHLPVILYLDMDNTNTPTRKHTQ